MKKRKKDITVKVMTPITKEKAKDKIKEISNFINSKYK